MSINRHSVPGVVTESLGTKFELLTFTYDWSKNVWMYMYVVCCKFTSGEAMVDHDLSVVLFAESLNYMYM